MDENETATAPTWSERSPELSELAAALSLAQGEMEPAPRASKNPFYNSTYADNASVRQAGKGPLSKHGLSVSQLPTTVDGQLGLRTVLLHSSGQWLAGILPVNPARDDSQGLGSALMYCRRYGYCAVTGVTQEGVDDDGNEAARPGGEEPTKPRSGRTTTAKPKTGKPGKGELNTMYRKATGKATPEDKRWTKEQLQTEMLLRYQTEHSSDLTREQFTEMQEWIKAGPPKDPPPPADSKTSPPAETQGGGPAGATTQPPPPESGPGTAAGEGGGSADGLAAYMDWGTKILKARSDGGDLEALRAQVRTAEGLTPALRAELYKRIDEGDTDGQEET